MYKYIYELRDAGKLKITSEDTRLALAEESLVEDERLAYGEDDEISPTEVTPEKAEQVNEALDEVEEETKEEEQPVNRIQSLDIVNQVAGKFDIYMEETKIPWHMYINNGKIHNTENFKALEDLKNLLNNTIDEKNPFVVEFNTLYENMTDTSFVKNLVLYGREKYGKPFLAEGLTLILYELAVDWAMFLCRYFKEMPELKDTEDSFYKKFPNLRFLTYIAKLFNDSKEFGKLITDTKARDLLQGGVKYNLSASQIKKKPSLYRAKGESLSYYASLVRHNYADILVGALDKIGTVAFLTGKNPVELHNRLSIIGELINTVVNNESVRRDTSVGGQTLTTTDRALTHLEMKCTDLLRGRSDARIMLESNEKNYPMSI